ncbi:MAG: hypothetical protein LBE56_12540 [Tannerella sp.]|jgi:CHASE3 domain sensor protein|nr:hypothetical protein [Tannerella sp.]
MEDETEQPEEKEETGSDSDETEDSPDASESAENAVSTEQDDKKTQEKVANTQGEDKGEQSPKTNLYSSIAKALKEDDIFTLEDLDTEKIQSADDFADTFNREIEKKVQERFDETQKKIYEAMNAGMTGDSIREFEGMINQLNAISDETLAGEDSQAEKLRTDLIFTYFYTKGFDQAKAQKMTRKSIDAGTDVEDARDALEELKTHYRGEYDRKIEETRKATEDRRARERDMSKNIEKKILETEEPVKGVKLTATERKAVLSQFKDYVDKTDGKENSVPLNAIGKYAKENPIDFQYNLNILYYLTNGFKDLSKVLSKEKANVKKSALSDLERIIRNPASGNGAELDFGNDRSAESKYNVVFD